MKTAILDIDGCCISIDARLPYLLAGDWQTFLKMHMMDVPIPQGVYFYKQLLADPEIRCVFVTARFEVNRHITINQLTTIFGEQPFEILMHPVGPRMDDATLKLQLIREAGIKPEDIFIAFDDRPSVIDAYREQGWTAYQTNKGY